MNINIISFVFDLLTNLLTFFTYIKYCNYYFVRSSSKLTFIINYICMIIFLIIISYLSMPSLWILLFILNLIFNKLIYHSSIRQNIYHVIRFNILYYIPVLIGYILMTYMFHSSLFLGNEFYLRLKGIIVCTIVYIVFSLILNNKKSGVSQLINPYKKYIYILFCLISVIFCALVIFSATYKDSKDTIETVILTSFFINVMMVILIISIYEKMVDFLNESALEQLKLQKYELNQNFYEELSEKSKQLGSLRHDFKNHLGIIQGELEQANYEEAMLYLNSLIDYTQAASELIITNNQTISSILNSKKSECIRKCIPIEYEIDFDKIYKITDMDLIIILGNILDNAIHAASKDMLEYREIKLSIEQVNSYLAVVCTNNFKEKPIELYGRLISTRKDKVLHGIGLNNVLETCEKYSGECNYSYDNQTFTISILLSNY